MSAITVPITSPVSEFLKRLFSCFEALQVRYCVLHSSYMLPDRVESDLDLAVHPLDRNKLPRVYSELREAGYLPVQVREYATNSMRVDFAWFVGPKPVFVGVDVVFEYRYAGLILAPGEDLVRDRIYDRRGFWVAHPETEFAYLLMKKTLKGAVTIEQADRLQELVGTIGQGRARELAGKVFGDRDKTAVVNYCRERKFAEHLGRLRSSLRRTNLARRPSRIVRYWYGETIRLWKRLISPTGLFLVILGPDGVGKSTLTNCLTEILLPVFRSEHMFHWRPGVIRKLRHMGVPLPDPHGRPPHGVVMSVASLGSFWADFVIGYCVRIRPLLVRSGLVIFNRYYHDLLVDQRRYRYGGPEWLPRVLASLVPPRRPLLLILDAPAEVIQSRKCEVTDAEVRRQRYSYLTLTEHSKNAVVVDTSCSIEQMVAGATKAALDYMAARALRQHAAWLVSS